MQDLWKLKVDWDEPLPDNHTRWREFEAAFPTTSINVPQWLGTSSTVTPSLHGFFDVSQKVLGAVIYLCVVDGSNNVRVFLVAAKSKIAPLKQTTIP